MFYLLNITLSTLNAQNQRQAFTGTLQHLLGEEKHINH